MCHDENAAHDRDDQFTVIADGYSDPEDALDWCRSNGLGADDCCAKKNTSGGDHEGTMRLQ